MTVRFNPIKSFEVGDTFNLNVGDFNGDGISDLVTINFGTRDDRGARVSTLLGNGTNDFITGSDFKFETSNVIPPVRLGDFNGDGKDDLLVISNAISVLLASENGSFNSVGDFEFGDSLYSIAVGDFNGDGKDDLVWSDSWLSSEVSVALASGNGAFSATQKFDVGSSLSGYPTVEDFNNDGKDDIAFVDSSVVNGIGSISVILADGNVGLNAPQNFDVEGRLDSLMVGDFNGDGNSDLVGIIKNYDFMGDLIDSNEVSVFLGNGNGSFSTAQNFTLGNANILSIEVGDFDGDGKDDLAAAVSEPSNNILVLSEYNNGSFNTTQNFSVAIDFSRLSRSSTASFLEAGDFNSDGKDDLAIRDRFTFGKDISVLFTSSNTRSKAIPLISDFNGDGKADTFLNKLDGSNVVTLRNSFDVITSDTLVPVSDTNWVAQQAADFNGDGKGDILWRNQNSGDNAIWTMDGTTVTSYDYITNLNKDWYIQDAADFNNDGKGDILWRNQKTGENTIWTMDGTSISSSDDITSLQDLSWQILDTADFNGDRKDDILWRNQNTGENAIWTMDRSNVYSYDYIASVNDLKWQIQGTADFNGDGKDDILWRNQHTGENAIWTMNGVSVESYDYIDSLDQNWQLEGIGDFNGDNLADIIWNNSSTGENTLWLMNGSDIIGNDSFVS